MDLNLPIMGASDTPIYKQVFDGIAAQILCGSLPGGTCLPPIRTIAAQLGISVITIKRAWEELERSGLITTNVGRGCFVAQLTEQKRNEMRMEIAQAEVKKLMPLFRLLGLTAEDAVFIIKRVFLITCGRQKNSTRFFAALKTELQAMDVSRYEQHIRELLHERLFLKVVRLVAFCMHAVCMRKYAHPRTKLC